MIVCKIEMWPGGRDDHPRKREIGRVVITNVGGSNQVGHYDVVIPKSAEYAKSGGIWKRGQVFNFPRKRLGPHDLLLRALIACIGPRSEEAVLTVGNGTLGGGSMEEAGEIAP